MQVRRGVPQGLVHRGPHRGRDRPVTLATLAGETITRVELLGASAALKFTQDTTGLHVTFTSTTGGTHAYVLRLSGLELQPYHATHDRNPTSP